MFLLLIIYMKKKKNIRERQDRRNFEIARVLFVICTRVT